ncbi:MAG: hypothetical protein GXY34_11220 [Syntrophomonadaceae bacterium]|nr:hypothetical protein [Syntrophomonadaceae bacterium]
MLIQFTLLDLMIFLVCALGIAVGILLISILWNIKKAVGVLGPTVENNRELIEKTIQNMPVICENFEQISINVRGTTDKLKSSIPVILQEVECITGATKGSIEMASAAIDNLSFEVIGTVASFKKDSSEWTTYLNIIAEIFQTIYRTFYSSKQ